MGAIERFLQGEGFLARQSQEAGDIVRHPALDLGEDAAIGAVQRVVQVENPLPHMAEIRSRKGTGAESRAGLWCAAHGPDHTPWACPCKTALTHIHHASLVPVKAPGSTIRPEGMKAV